MQSEAKFADFLGIELIQIYLIGGKVPNFENCNRVVNHFTLLIS